MSAIPWPYKAFFLYIEPISTIVGAYFAWFQPQYYLQLTHTASAPGYFGVPVGTEVVLRQLGNLYFAFTLNEALVLRATSDLKVWRTLLLGLLIADLGHLYSCFPLGLNYYYDIWNWNSIAWGNIAFVYCGATLRSCFLLGIGLGSRESAKPIEKAVSRVSTGSKTPASKKVQTPVPASPVTPAPPAEKKTPKTRSRRTKSKS